MSILEIKNLSHLYDSKTLFENGNLTINNGEHIGIVGLNGAGKTTFVNIITGKIMHDAGEIKWLNNIRKGYLDQHADIDRSLSVLDYLKTSFTHLYELNATMENLYEQVGMTEDLSEMETLINRANNILEKLTNDGFFDLEASIKKVANGLGVNAFGYDTIIGTLSGGQRAKLLLSKLLLEDLDVMILDEPTNFLDVEHIDWLINYLNSFKGAFLVISHDNEFLNKICKGVVNIENGMIKKYSGTFDDYLLQREQNAKQYEESYIRQQREIEKLNEYIEKNKARASTAGMANSRKKMLEKIDVMRKPIASLEANFAFYSELVHTNEMLIVSNLEIGYNKPLLPPINFQIYGGSKLWIRGTNGIGKSTLIKTLLNKINKLSGDFQFHIATKIGYLEQDPEFYNMEINATTYINDQFPKLNIKDQRTLLGKVGIKGEMALKPIKNLSGGEQVRIRLATLMVETTNFLILDEPTNHLDNIAKTSLREALLDYKGTMILVSHDREFAEGVCDKTLDIK